MTGDEATQQSDLLVLNGAVEPDQAEVAVAGGTAFALTRRDPEKDTDNEDPVAIIPGRERPCSSLLTAPAGCRPGNAHR